MCEFVSISVTLGGRQIGQREDLSVRSLSTLHSGAKNEKYGFGFAPRRRPFRKERERGEGW